MRSRFLFLAAIGGVTGVGLGAFGAHGLKEVLSPQMLEVYKTAVSYQLWHSLALGLISVFEQNLPANRLLHWAGSLMFSGIVIFSGSLYLLAVFNLSWLGMLTPIGGLAFIGAWLLLAIFAAKAN